MTSIVLKEKILGPIHEIAHDRIQDRTDRRDIAK